MTEIAKLIEIDGSSFKIDGAEFPYWIGTEITVDDYPHGIPGSFSLVTVTLIADRVRVCDVPEHTTVTRLIDGEAAP